MPCIWGGGGVFYSDKKRQVILCREGCFFHIVIKK